MLDEKYKKLIGCSVIIDYDGGCYNTYEDFFDYYGKDNSKYLEYKLKYAYGKNIPNGEYIIVDIKTHSVRKNEIICVLISEDKSKVYLYGYDTMLRERQDIIDNTELELL